MRLVDISMGNVVRDACFVCGSSKRLVPQNASPRDTERNPHASRVPRTVLL